MSEVLAGSDLIRVVADRQPPLTTELRIHDPATGELVGIVPCSSPDEARSSVTTARAAFDSWRRITPADRGRLLHLIADRLQAEADELAWLTTREMGKPLADARGGVEAGINTVRQYAELGPVHRGHALQGGWNATDLMIPQPRGVVGVFTPWNDPVAVPCGILAAALVTGNVAIFKPSERTPHTGIRLANTISESLHGAGLPPGILNLVIGDGRLGALLVDSSGLDVLVHVGSTSAGRQIALAGAATGAKVLLENGGKDALLVDRGVDPQWAAEQAAVGAFANAGQICTSVERIYVHSEIADEFIDALTSLATGLRMGPGTDPATQLGPLVDQRQRDQVHRHVSQAVTAGAKCLTGGAIPDRPGSFYPATVLTDCTADMAVMRDETFGPVAPVCRYTRPDEAIVAANASGYGLAATVLTSDMRFAQQAWRELEVGTVKVNAVFGGAPGGAATPRRASGAGFGYGPELLDELTVTKVVHLSGAPAPAP